MPRIGLFGVALLLVGCGLKGELKPVAPHTLPPAPRGARVQPSGEDMLIKPSQAEPLRVDDPVKKSEERPDDRFNIPPQD